MENCTKNHMEIFWFMTFHKKLLWMKKPLHIWFDKVDGFVKVYDGARSLVLFSPERYDAIYDRVKYFISRKSGITYSTDHNFARMKFDSNNFLPIEKKQWLLIIL